jgi:hypothetical protein
VAISVASEDDALAKQAFKMYTDVLEDQNIHYGLQDESN